ncbi:MAG: hypothetical protein RR051_03135, partial [Clostridiales bacterium]
MRKRDVIVIICTMVLILIGSQVFHLIRYHALQERISSEFYEQSDQLSAALAEIKADSAGNCHTNHAQAVAYTLGTLVEYTRKSQLTAAESSELRMFLWQLSVYLNDQITMTPSFNAILPTLTAIFTDFSHSRGNPDIAQQLYTAMHRTE